jgi:hypothetical protein
MFSISFAYARIFYLQSNALLLTWISGTELAFSERVRHGAANASNHGNSHPDAAATRGGQKKFVSA